MRKFSIIRLSLLSIVFVGLGSCSFSKIGPPIAESFVFVQLTDPHIPETVEETAQSPAAENLKLAIKELNASKMKPDFVIITGDIAAEKGSLQAYQRFKTLISELKFPIYLAIGNHDHRGNFRKVLLEDRTAGTEPYYYSFSHKGCHFVILDSKEEGSLSGNISSDQLSWLMTDLEKHHDMPTFVFLHHQCQLVGTADEHNLQNCEQLLAVLKTSPKVVFLANGHVHQSKIIEKDGLYFINTIAVSYTFRQQDGPPGYRIFEVVNSGYIVTYDHRLGNSRAAETARLEF